MTVRRPIFVVTDDLACVVVAVTQERSQIAGDRMIAKIGRQQPDPETTLRCTIVLRWRQNIGLGRLLACGEFKMRREASSRIQIGKIKKTPE